MGTFFRVMPSKRIITSQLPSRGGIGSRFVKASAILM